MKNYDVVIIGAGASGLMCALSAGQRGRKVLILDHSDRVGRKILISGGGSCNFTNLYLEAEYYISGNSHFCKSALSRFSQYDFISLVDKSNLEKTLSNMKKENFECFSVTINPNGLDTF